MLLRFFGSAPGTVAAETGRLRALCYHPEQFLDLVPAAQRSEAEGWAAQKQQWLQVMPEAHLARRRCQAIRQANAALAKLLVAAGEQARGLRQLALQGERADAVWNSREYAFCLFPDEDLAKFLLEISGGAP